MLPNTMTFHIALSSMPQGNHPGDTSFMEVVADSYANLKKTIKDYYRKDSTQDGEADESINDYTYIPAKYFLLGTYDAAFITLVDRFKFSQRLIQPLPNSEKTDLSYFPNSFQIISGITSTEMIKKKEKLHVLFPFKEADKNITAPPFLTICNIKLNNSLLIGNGNKFIEQVQDKIQELIDNTIGKDELTFIVQSFSWFEVSILMFIEDIDKVSPLLFQLRKLRVSDFTDPTDLAKLSLYKNLPDGFAAQTDAKIENSHVIIDTHTYVGLHADHIENDELFNKITSKEYKTIDSEIEWHLKPGHLPGLIKIIEEDKVVAESFDLSKINLLIGKSDYLISNTSGNSFSDNLKVFRLLLKNSPNSLFDHIRKMKTRVFFGGISRDLIEEHSKQGNLGITRFVSDLNKLAVSNSLISKTNEILKSLKVSRQVRAKVIKTFYNYNNVIQNSVLYTFFLDLGHFIYNLILTIQTYEKKFENTKKGLKCSTESIHEIETNLIELIDIFQEGYNIRVLNCYEYEEITDFDLDFNSSIEQLLTTYNSIVISIGKNVYNNTPGQTVFAPIVRLNLKNTVSNYDSINYSVYNFLAPEFIFFTIHKEALNHFKHNSTQAKEKIDKIQKLFSDMAKNDEYLNDLAATNSLDFDYYYIDAVRYELVCNHDFNLFYYWFWTTNFQNASLYDTIGVMKEKHFKTELFRIMFVAKLFGEEVTEISCPKPSLENYWERYYLITKNAVDHLFKSEELIVRIRTLIYDEVGQCLSKFKRSPQFQNNPGPGATKDHYSKILNTNSGLLHHYFPPEELADIATAQGVLLQEYIPNYSQFLRTFYQENKARMSVGESPIYQGQNELPQNLFLYGLMHSYLRLLYDLNNRKINFLYRSWENGKPMHSFIDVADKDALCFIDQTGSVFFLAESKANIYFSMRNSILLTLMDFANKYKIELFSDIVSRSQIFNYGPINSADSMA